MAALMAEPIKVINKKNPLLRPKLDGFFREDLTQI